MKAKKIPVHFYEESSGNEPVRDWLNDLNKKDKKTIGEDIKSVQTRWPLGMPLVRSLGKGLWEIRSSLDNRIARVIFVMKNEKLVLLHGFIKKSQKTPSTDLELAQGRSKKIKFNKE